MVVKSCTAIIFITQFLLTLSIIIDQTSHFKQEILKLNLSNLVCVLLHTMKELNKYNSYKLSTAPAFSPVQASTLPDNGNALAA
jgi:hypothetical protein